MGFLVSKKQIKNVIIIRGENIIKIIKDINKS